MRALFVCVFIVTGTIPTAAERFLRGQPMPDRPGCEVTHCERRWDDELQLSFKRCYWRCPRERPPRLYTPAPPRRELPPPPRIPQYEARIPAVRTAPANELNVFLVCLGIAALLGLAWVIDRLQTIANLRSAERTTHLALYDAQEAADAQAKLESAARAADEIIKRQAARAFRRGRDST